MEHQIKLLGELVDKCGDVIAMNETLIPQQTQLKAMRSVLQEIRDELKSIFFALGGDPDTWE